MIICRAEYRPLKSVDVQMAVFFVYSVLNTDTPDARAKQNWCNSQLLCFLLSLWYNPDKVVINMDTKEILLELRTKRGLSQEQLAEQVHVTRQAVSRWETGGSLR